MGQWQPLALGSETTFVKLLSVRAVPVSTTFLQKPSLDGWVGTLRGQRNQEPPWAGAYCLWAKGDVDRPLSENGPTGLCTGADSGPQKSTLQTVDRTVS